MPARRRLVAILFADIVGFSRRLSEDEPAGLEQRRRIEAMVRAAAVAHGGRVVKTIGDAAMLAFDSAVQAVECALEIQDAARKADGEPEAVPGAQVRIGLHAGDVVEEEDGDLFGNTVNIAARLEKAASPGGICLSREVYAQVRPTLALECVPVPPERLRNLPEPVGAVEILPERADRLPAPLPEGDAVREVGEAPSLPVPRSTPALDRARQLARRQDDDDLISPLWTIGAGIGLAVTGAAAASLAGWLGQWPEWGQVTFILQMVGRMAPRFALFCGAWLVLYHLIYRPLLKPLFQRLDFAMLGPEGLDEEVALHCAGLGEVSPAIAGPVDRALTAYTGITGIGREDVWTDRRIPVEKHTKQARAELLALLNRARHLAKVDATLRRFDGEAEIPVHYRELRQLHRRQCAKLEAAAEIFERAEAEFSRAFLAVSEQAPKSAPPEEPLREMQATFAALAEVLETLEEPQSESVLPLQAGDRR
jgi:class 3 adenylate cyclase